MRQKYSKEQLQKIVDQYPNLGMIRQFEQIASGFENSNYLVKTKRLVVVIKIYEGDFTQGNVTLESRLMKKAYNAGVKSPYVYVNRKNKLFNLINGKLSLVMEFLPGENMYEKKLANSLVLAMGRQTGLMDKVFADERRSKHLRRQSAFNMNFFRTIKERISILPEGLDKQLFIDLFGRFDTIKPIFNAMPKGLIHNDIGPQNVLAQKQKLVGIIDFSNFAFSPYIQNIAVALTNTCFNYHWQPEQVVYFIRGYREHRKVTRDELMILHYLIAARYATVIIEFNYHNRKFGFDEKRAQIVRDQYGFLQKFLALPKDLFKPLGKRRLSRPRNR